MLKIFQPPESFSLGLEDRFNTKMVQTLNDSGVRCIAKRLWPDFLARHLFFSNLPSAYRVYLSFVAPFYCRRHLSTICSDDVVWINGPSLPITDTRCKFEKEVIQRGASYIFWLEDDYFSDPVLKPTAEARMELAHLTVAVTPNLKDRVVELYPDKSIIVLEEPIDAERLRPKETPQGGQQPLIIWGGRPWALKTLLMLNGVLERVYRDVPFTLRIITGSKKPKIDLSIPWEWVAYDSHKEAEYAAGAFAGLAPLEDTNFNSCKGNYKVKTYMALGIPPLTSPVGYNNYLIKHGETGFLLNSEMEWESALRTVLDDASFAAKVGKAARAHIIGRYSYKALMPVWAKALQDAFPKKLANPHSTQPSYQN
jgi:glycosyltransferase involved in cell wall biosynthesis